MSSWEHPKMPDEILTELWKIRDAIAKEHGNDLDSLVAYLRSKEKLDSQGVVDLHAARTTADKSPPVDVDKARR
jgi:hypothetical protein